MPYGIPNVPGGQSEQALPATKTPIEAVDLYKALAEIWPAVVGNNVAPRSALLLLLAQSALETGYWQRGIYNYNLGNLKHSPGDGYSYHVLERCPEHIAGQVVYVRCEFRAYPTLNAAAYDYLSLLYRKYQSSWQALLRGDVETFSKRLKANGYYSVPEPQYTAQLRSIYRKYDRGIVEEPTANGQVAIYDRTSYVQDAPLARIDTGLAIVGILSLAGGVYGLRRYWSRG